MISATISGSIIKEFDEVIQTVVMLATFIPMLMDTGGNAGPLIATIVDAFALTIYFTLVRLFLGI